MTDYFLTTESMRLVTKNERDKVIKRKSFKRGDKVDVSMMDEARLDLLVEKGTLVTDQDEAEDAGQPEDVTPKAEQGAGNLTGPETPLDPTTQDAGSGGADGDSTQEENPDNPEVVDEFSEMPFSELQQAAKTATGDGSGSADDLRARLRANKAANPA